jgi:hypothetical protein
VYYLPSSPAICLRRRWLYGAVGRRAGSVRILTRRGTQRTWGALEVRPDQGEVVLQKLLAGSPDLLPMEEIREGASSLVATVREPGLPGSGNTAVLGFSTDGGVAVIECKLAANNSGRHS